LCRLDRAHFLRVLSSPRGSPWSLLGETLNSTWGSNPRSEFGESHWRKVSELTLNTPPVNSLVDPYDADTNYSTWGRNLQHDSFDVYSERAENPRALSGIRALA